MSAAADGGPAFPWEAVNCTPGCSRPQMSLRDWFAGQAREEDIKAHSSLSDYKLFRGREQARYRYADEMLAARKEKP